MSKYKSEFLTVIFALIALIICTPIFLGIVINFLIGVTGRTYFIIIALVCIISWSLLGYFWLCK